ncbi:MAG: hypothetical protein J0M08_12295 [Bacteroidetes bacterium]|nr:hypothetical protein [Bacteroidota bacterium]
MKTKLLTISAILTFCASSYSKERKADSTFVNQKKWDVSVNINNLSVFPNGISSKAAKSSGDITLKRKISSKLEIRVGVLSKNYTTIDQLYYDKDLNYWDYNSIYITTGNLSTDIHKTFYKLGVQYNLPIKENSQFSFGADILYGKESIDFSYSNISYYRTDTLKNLISSPSVPSGNSGGIRWSSTFIGISPFVNFYHALSSRFGLSVQLAADSRINRISKGLGAEFFDHVQRTGSNDQKDSWIVTSTSPYKSFASDLRFTVNLHYKFGKRVK